MNTSLGRHNEHLLPFIFREIISVITILIVIMSLEDQPSQHTSETIEKPAAITTNVNGNEPQADHAAYLSNAEGPEIVPEGMEYSARVDSHRDAAEANLRKGVVENLRKLKVIVIGAGYSGIYHGVRIPERIKNCELTIYEKNDGVGGTWWVFCECVDCMLLTGS